MRIAVYLVKTDEKKIYFFIYDTISKLQLSIMVYWH